MREVDVSAPGRVNLIGDHTDYNDGFVLPMAIDLACRVRGRAVDGATSLRWLDGGDESSERIAAAVRVALAARVGLDAEVSSTIPIGRGLSSSSALAAALTVAHCAADERSLPLHELAHACRDAEEAATGVATGIMDQLTCLGGVEGCALLIDCRSLELRPVPIPSGVGVIVVDSGRRRTLAGSEYAERRAACERIAAELGVPALRDASLADVADEPRARHVVSENARVLSAAAALAAGDLATLGRLMLESHASLRDDYEVSTPELDQLVDALVAAGAAGARLTGAGFGGSVVAVASRARAAAIAAEFPRSYVVRAVAGATAAR